MNNRNNNSGSETPAVFRNILPKSDADRLDGAMKALPEDGYSAASVADKTLAKLGLARSSTEVRSKTVRLPRFRVALIAACVAVMLLATVAAAKVIYDTRFFGLLSTENAEKDLAEAFIPLGCAGKLGDTNITVEDMVGDAHRMFIEIRTDYSMENTPDGWLSSYLPSLRLQANCTVPGTEGCSTTDSFPFVRDGKLWYMVSFSEDSAAGVDISRLPVRLTLNGTDEETNLNADLTFDWTNNYVPKDRTITVSRDLGDFRVDRISLTVSQLIVEASKPDFFDFDIDHITLKDGTDLYFTDPGSPLIQNLGTYTQDGDRRIATRFYNLLEGFSTARGGEPVFVSIEDIASVTINGTVITLE